MSWFDATGIASLAKTALKEAQKTIDKALDITEDDESSRSKAEAALKSSSSSSELSAHSQPTETAKVDAKIVDEDGGKMMRPSISNPILSSVATGTTASNLWDSFTGSFFETTNSSEDQVKPAVTIAPSSTNELRAFEKRESTTTNVPLNSTRTTTSGNTSGRTSSASVSESVELLSSPISPSSGLTSPSTSKN